MAAKGAGGGSYPHDQRGWQHQRHRSDGAAAATFEPCGWDGRGRHRGRRAAAAWAPRPRRADPADAGAAACVLAGGAGGGPLGLPRALRGGRLRRGRPRGRDDPCATPGRPWMATAGAAAARRRRRERPGGCAQRGAGCPRRRGSPQPPGPLRGGRATGRLVAASAARAGGPAARRLPARRGGRGRRGCRARRGRRVGGRARGGGRRARAPRRHPCTRGSSGGGRRGGAAGAAGRRGAYRQTRRTLCAYQCMRARGGGADGGAAASQPSWSRRSAGRLPLVGWRQVHGMTCSFCAAPHPAWRRPMGRPSLSCGWRPPPHRGMTRIDHIRRDRGTRFCRPLSSLLLQLCRAVTFMSADMAVTVSRQR